MLSNKVLIVLLVSGICKAAVEENNLHLEKSHNSEKDSFHSNAKIHHETSENKICKVFNNLFILIFLDEKLLRAKLNEQSNAIKSLLKIKDNKQRSHMLNELGKKIKKTMLDNQNRIQSQKYTPEKQQLPNDKEIREATSSVMENTAFLSELSLHFPEFMKKVFIKDGSFKTLFTWAFNFSEQLSFYDMETSKILNLAGQELEIIERADNYTNPYKKSKEEIEREAYDEMLRNQERKKEAKALDAKMKKNKQPKLSKSEL